MKTKTRVIIDGNNKHDKKEKEKYAFFASLPFSPIYFPNNRQDQKRKTTTTTMMMMMTTITTTTQ